jgi:multidrug efflux pump subunit AcrA (membrane-fusion protein)
LLVLAAAAVGVYALTRGGHGDDGEKKLVTVEKGSITEKALAVGQIQPRQKYSVKSKISGIVKRCMVNVGDKVKAGDPLFEIAPDPTPLEQTEVDRQVDSAQASYNRAKLDYERSVELQRQGIVPKSDVDSRRETYELAKIALEKAQQNRADPEGRVVTASTDIDSSSGRVRRHDPDRTGIGRPRRPLTSHQPGPRWRRSPTKT